MSDPTIPSPVERQVEALLKEIDPESRLRQTIPGEWERSYSVDDVRALLTRVLREQAEETASLKQTIAALSSTPEMEALREGIADVRAGRVVVMPPPADAIEALRKNRDALALEIEKYPVEVVSHGWRTVFQTVGELDAIVGISQVQPPASEQIPSAGATAPTDVNVGRVDVAARTGGSIPPTGANTATPPASEREDR